MPQITGQINAYKKQFGKILKACREIRKKTDFGDYATFLAYEKSNPPKFPLENSVGKGNWGVALEIKQEKEAANEKKKKKAVKRKAPQPVRKRSILVFFAFPDTSITGKEAQVILENNLDPQIDRKIRP